MDIKPKIGWITIMISTILIVFIIASCTDDPIIKEATLWLVKNTPKK